MKTETTSCKSQAASGAWEQPWLNGRLKHTLCSKANFVVLAAFVLLWFILFNELRVEWTINPQYSYGWVVPLLALGLLLRRLWPAVPLSPLPSSQLSTLNSQLNTARSPATGLLCLFIACAAMILPLRLLLEATPGWRTLNLLLALYTIGLTLIGIYIAAGRWWTRYLAFPICFILVAVPWPHTIEAPLIQGLTYANARLVVEIMGLLGMPAVHHGNVIEVHTGIVGVDEACSGIRSFQSSVMVSLFLGEFFRLGLKSRLLLVPFGFVIAFSFNVCRTSLLVWIAASKGLAAIGNYHDSAGVSILLACTATLWLIACFLHLAHQKAASKRPQTELPEAPRGLFQASAVLTEPCTNSQPSTLSSHHSFSVQPLALSLAIWLLAVEAGVEFWYRAHEFHAPKGPEWALNWPPRETSFRAEPVPPVSRAMLAYDEGHSGTWESAEGAYWKVYYFRWLPGRLALASARGHNPSVCLTAAGKQLRELNDNHSPIQIGPILFPFRRYEFMEGGHVVHVFHCLWEEHAAGAYFEFDPTLSQIQLRLQAVLEGRRNLGQRSLEVFISGIEDPRAAETAMTAQLQKLIQVVRAR